MLTAAAVSGLAIAGCAATGPSHRIGPKKRRSNIDTQFYARLSTPHSRKHPFQLIERPGIEHIILFQPAASRLADTEA